MTLLAGIDDYDVVTGELSGTGHDGCSGVGQGGLCQAADREWCQHPSLPHYSSSGGAVQHGKTHLSMTVPEGLINVPPVCKHSQLLEEKFVRALRSCNTVSNLQPDASTCVQ